MSIRTIAPFRTTLVAAMTALAIALPRPAAAQVLNDAGLSRPDPPSRPAALVPLYMSFATLQVLDGAATLRSVGQGATEANPLMRSTLGSPVTFAIAKGALAGGSVYFTERLWRKNRAAAIGVMVALNGVSAAVVAHNWPKRR